jgi:hypothetical protein
VDVDELDENGRQGRSVAGLPLSSRVADLHFALPLVDGEVRAKPTLISFSWFWFEMTLSDDNERLGDAG